ncbi:MAG: hypothetical protein ABSD71_08630 [Bacteroidales bacterium]|jgi:hypothetical protein
MRTIKFSEEEISSLHKVYLEKLAQAEKDLQRIKDVLKKLEVSIPKETVEEETIVIKRGRKPKVKVIEPKVPKKRGRKPKVVASIVESIPETVIKEPKKRGRKPKEKGVEFTVPKKRGRPAKVTVVSTNEVSALVPKEPKKRGRKPKVSNVPTAESELIPVNAEEKKIFRKKSPYKKRRKSGKRITLKNLSNPLKLKEPKEDPIDKITPEVEPIASPTMENIIAQIEEQDITPTEEPKE